MISDMDIEGFFSFAGPRTLPLPGWLGMNASSSKVFGFRSRCFGGLAIFIAFARTRRFASFASWFNRRRKRIMEEMNFKTSSRPSWLTLDVGIIDGKRCHFSISRRSSSAWFSSTDGMSGLLLSHFVKIIVNGTLRSMSQSAYSRSLSMGGIDASIKSNTPAKLERVVKYSFVNASHFAVSSALALANPYPGRSTIHHFFATR
mmetsp:Transcript_13760/g.51496  ORF Transcript_13760/g.51496 Transcript_13760/m.51496 type:complete len:203 (+) Transcript_13760:3396-4004(+)